MTGVYSAVLCLTGRTDYTSGMTRPVVHIPPKDPDASAGDGKPERARRIDARPVLDRFVIPLTPDGKPAVDRMREPTREQLRRILADPDTARGLGLGADAAVPTVPIDLAYAALGTINQLSTLIVASITKAPPAIVLAIMPYTEQERDVLAPPLHRVLSKYGGPALSRWSDEIALVLALVAVTQAKIAAVKVAARAARSPATVVPFPSPAPDAPTGSADAPGGSEAPGSESL